MDVTNSSMYDGMTSFAEACILAFSQTKKNKVVEKVYTIKLYKFYILTLKHVKSLK